jgi:Xaa-Pro aminopeptidase
MRNVKMETGFFTQNRKNLAKILKPGSIAIVNSNDIMPTNADGTMKFKQNSDLFYLSGIMQEESVLLLFPDSKSERNREILFIRDYNKDLEVWEGKKLSVEEARGISGIQRVEGLSHFDDVLQDLVVACENIYLNSNEHDRAKRTVEDRDVRFIRMVKERYPLHNYMRLAPLLYGLRELKQPVEIELTQKACDISGKGFDRILKFVKPGVYEYEIEAEYAHEFIKNGEGFADYEPIIASGENSCFLHYIKNDDLCNDGDVLLLDVAAGCGLYNADMTRTIPVNGRFTKRQRSVYDAVLRALRGTIAEMKPGRTVQSLQITARELIAKELVDLKLVKTEDVKDLNKKSDNFKKYYPHDVSHFLGLSVHDVGGFDQEMKPGMILTCEPGIYIREEKLGVRLENDILITKEGNIDLMKSVPLEADEIEGIMNK